MERAGGRNQNFKDEQRTQQSKDEHAERNAEVDVDELVNV